MGRLLVGLCYAVAVTACAGNHTTTSHDLGAHLDAHLDAPLPDGVGDVQGDIEGDIEVDVKGDAKTVCTFDTWTYSPNGQRESITAYGQYWNFDVSGTSTTITGDLTSIARYASGPCTGRAAGTCTFDARTFSPDGQVEYISAYGKYWQFDVATSALTSGDLRSIARYVSGPCK
jgi:hypothetical protein